MVALLMLVLGAVQYTASAAIPSTRVAARGRMTNAVLGLLLLFGTYVILNTINPELVMPGLGLSGTMGTEKLTIPPISMPQLIGVILYDTEDCSDGGRRYLYSQETLNLGTDDNWDNRAVAFKIFKIDDKIQFFRENKFTGEASLELTGPRDCTMFKEYAEKDIARSDLTQDISSLKFIYDEIGVTLCVSDQPIEDNCRLFDAYPGLQPEKMENILFGSVGTTLTFYTPNHYDLCGWEGGALGGCTDPYSPINDNESKWIDVPCGMYAMLCVHPPNCPAVACGFGTGDFPARCYFLLESTVLKFWGDQTLMGTLDKLDVKTSSLMMLGHKDKYYSENSDSDICKGVNFYTGENFNRHKTFWGLREEAAGFPIGWGDLSDGNSVDLTTNEYNFTQISDITTFAEMGIAGGYDISSLKIFGNGCKLRICDGTDPVIPAPGDDCDTLYGTYGELPCQEAAIVAGTCAGPSAACEKPPGVSLGCNCGPDAVAGDPCSCCTDADADGKIDYWDDFPGGGDAAVIKSFILCNKDDNVTPECAGW